MMRGLAPAITSSCALPFLFQPVIETDAVRGWRYEQGALKLIDRNSRCLRSSHSKSIVERFVAGVFELVSGCAQTQRLADAGKACRQMGIDTYIGESEPSSQAAETRKAEQP